MRKWLFSSILVFASFSCASKDSYKTMLSHGSNKSYALYVDANEERFIGTGFVVEVASGKKFMMTAGHVCDAASAHGFALFTTYDKATLAFTPAKWTSYNSHDICVLAEVGKDFPAYKLAGEAPKVGDKIFAIGHPVGWNLTVMQGNAVGYENVVVATDHALSECTGAYKKIMQLLMGVIPIGEICAINAPELATTMSSAPGASGSPILNEDGELIGILSAGDNRTAAWTLVVPFNFLLEVTNTL